VTAVRDEDFDLTVTIATEQTGQFLTVTRTAHAAEFLLERWPKNQRGREYRSALLALVDVMEQRKTVSVARKAFAAAARKAKVLVREGRADAG
jgi:ribosomal protein S4